MDPLKRDNAGVRATNHEDRIQALERRIFPQATQWAYCELTTPQTIGAGSAEVLAFDRFWTDSPTIFDTLPGPNTPGDTLLRCFEFGVYLAISAVEWEDIGSGYPHSHNINTSRLINAALATFGVSGASASDLQWTVAPSGVLDTGDISLGMHTPFDYTSTQPAAWELQVNNGHVADVDVTRALLSVALLPSDEPETTYVVYG